MREPALDEQYSSWERREHALRLGMWVFLASEITLFAGVFTLYSAYRAMYPVEFAEAAHHNTIFFGSANTLILITSSFTVALTIHAAREARYRLLTTLLFVTAAFGVAFLVLKGIEYAKHYHEGLLPGIYYHSAEMPAYGHKMFWTLYWFATGLHALHVTAGLTVLVWMGVRSIDHIYTPEHHTYLEMGTLYWHLVDIMWIFLWPLLYLTH